MNTQHCLLFKKQCEECFLDFRSYVIISCSYALWEKEGVDTV